MSKLLEVESELELCHKQKEFLNSFLNFHIEYDLIFEKDVDEIKKVYNSFKKYRINNTHRECESLKYILNNMNTIKEKEVNEIKLLKKPYDYICVSTNKSIAYDRCVLKIENSVIKIYLLKKKLPACWNWNTMNSLSIEIYFQKLSKTIIENSEIKDMVIVPEIYDYGIFEINNDYYLFFETEYIEDFISKQISYNIDYIDKITNILSKFISKYKKCVEFINTNLSLYCIDDANISKYIFTIEDVSEEIKKMGILRLLTKLYIILNNDKFINNTLVFNSNVYMSNDDKIVIIDFDSYSRKKVSKHFFFRLFNVLWKTEMVKKWY